MAAFASSREGGFALRRSRHVDCAPRRGSGAAEGGPARDQRKETEMIGKRLAATLAVAAVLGAGCKKQGGGDYQGGGTEHMPNDSTGMNGGATSGSNSPAEDGNPGSAPAPTGSTGISPAETQGGATTPGAGSGVPPVQAPGPAQTGPSTISTPTGNGTPVNQGGTRDTTGKRP